MHSCVAVELLVSLPTKLERGTLMKALLTCLFELPATEHLRDMLLLLATPSMLKPYCLF